MLSSLFIVSFLLLKVTSQRYSTANGKYKFGREAEILCKAYKKVCPTGKQCAIQELLWPRKMSFPVCVFETENPALSKICELPPAPGNCKAQFRRWYYNMNARQCSWFTFGGCKGNLNNFRSEEACISACLGKKKDVATAGSPFIINVTPKRPYPIRHPEVLPAPAPIPLRIRPETDISALNLKDLNELEASGMKEFKLKRKRGRGRGRGRKHRRNRKRKNKSRRRKNRVIGPYAELRMKKTSYRPRSDKLQNDQGNVEMKVRRRKNRRKNKRRKLRKNSSSGKGSYYDRIRLFTLLHHSPPSS